MNTHPRLTAAFKYSFHIIQWVIANTQRLLTDVDDACEAAIIPYFRIWSAVSLRKNFFMIRFVSTVWAFHLSRCATMQRHNNSFHCRNISLFAYRAFVVSGIVLNFYTCKGSDENHRSSKCQ